MARVRFLLAAAILGVAGAFTFGSTTRNWSLVETEAAATLRLEVDLSARRLAVIENGAVSTTYPVAIGKASYPTPKGRFQISRIIWNPSWVPPDSEWAAEKAGKAPGDPDHPRGWVKIFFSEPDYYIHGIREIDSLAEAESHGCLRMRNSDVTRLARTIVAAGGQPVGQNWVSRLVTKMRSTKEVRLAKPVAVTIRG